MSRVLITGSADGLGLNAAAALLDEGHQAVVHVRSEARREAVAELVARGADVVVGDLADPGQVRDLAEQVNRLGRMDAVIHNAGVMRGPVMEVNVAAPYVLSALIGRPERLIYLSSGMHRGGRADLARLDWNGGSYSDSKLFITAFSSALARRWPEVKVNAVTPGWVATKMGGPGAADELSLGHVTQVWLAVSDDPAARTSGGYWFHQRPAEVDPATDDADFQERLISALAEHTGVQLA